jgi:hypothetical protein
MLGDYRGAISSNPVSRELPGEWHFNGLTNRQSAAVIGLASPYGISHRQSHTSQWKEIRARSVSGLSDYCTTNCVGSTTARASGL